MCFPNFFFPLVKKCTLITTTPQGNYVKFLRKNFKKNFLRLKKVEKNGTFLTRVDKKCASTGFTLKMTPKTKKRVLKKTGDVVCGEALSGTSLVVAFVIFSLFTFFTEMESLFLPCPKFPSVAIPQLRHIMIFGNQRKIILPE